MLRVNNLTGFGRGKQPFTDDFTTLNTSKWTVTSSADVTTAFTSGELRFTADASWNGVYNGGNLQSIPNFDFTGRTIDIEFPSVTTNLGVSGAGPSGATYLMILDQNNTNNRALLLADGDLMLYRRSNNGTQSELSTATGLTDTKWRIEHVATDNTWKFYTWTSSFQLRFTSAAANWNPTNVKFKLGGDIYGTNQQNVATRIDNLISTARW